MKFVIAIEPGDATRAFGVVVPDLPGCFSAGDTLFHFHIDDKIITLQQRRSGDGTTSERW